MLINIRYHQKNKTFEGWVEKNNEQISIYYFKIVFWCLFLLKSFSIILRCFFLQISNLSKNYGNVDCSLSLFFNILPKQTECHKSTWDLGYVIFCIFAQKSDKHTEKHNDTHTCIHGHTYTHTYTPPHTHTHTLKQAHTTPKHNRVPAPPNYAPLWPPLISKSIFRATTMRTIFPTNHMLIHFTNLLLCIFGKVSLTPFQNSIKMYKLLIIYSVAFKYRI